MTTVTDWFEVPSQTFEKPSSTAPVGDSMPPLAEELMHALTAVANYLAAGRTLFDRNDPEERERLRVALELAQAQTARASVAMNRLMALVAEDAGTGALDKS